MNSLEMYKKLAKEDKENLEQYLIYQYIYDIAKEENKTISDDEITDLKEIIYDYFGSVDDKKLLIPTEFITKNYLSGYITIEQLKKFDNYELCDAIEEDDIDYLIDKIDSDNKMER